MSMKIRTRAGDCIESIPIYLAVCGDRSGGMAGGCNLSSKMRC